jgi:GNAT superfamily N-acetyltransferase
MAMELRNLQPDEGAVLRELWLRALADAPTAFGATLADERAKPDAHWTGLAHNLAGSPDQCVIIAYTGTQPCGIIHGSLDAEERETAHIGAMWVDPAVRRHGVGRALLEAITAWARLQGARRLELWVTEGNEAAIRHYERMGFQDTGQRRPLPSHPALQIWHMARDL